MIALDRFGWGTVAIWIALYLIGMVAILVCHHRAKPGHWRPYTDEEVSDPDWDRNH